MSDTNVDVAPTSGDTPNPAIASVADAATTPADSAPAPTDEGTEPPPADGEEPAKAPASVQKSINRLTRQRAEAERRAMRAEARAEALENIRYQTPTPAPPKAAELKQSDFGSYDEFIRAQARAEARAEVEERLRTAERDTSQRRSAEAGQQARATFEREAEAQAKTAGIDFKEQWETLLELPPEDVSEAVAAYLFQAAENKAALVDYLANNLDEIGRISRMPPIVAARELAKVDARLGARPAPKRSSAPPPPPTLGGGGVAPQSIDRMAYGDVRKLVAGWAKK